MERSSFESFNNPTTRRLAWIKSLLLDEDEALISPASGIRPVFSRDLTPQPGVILIAPPMMHDPNFRRTVVLLCDQSPEGSFGLILNRPLTAHLGEIIEELEEHSFAVGQGGPVQPDTLHFIHTLGERVPDAIAITPEVYWGGDFESMKILIETGEVSRKDVRFFLGYGGWSPGQLLQEIEMGGWILAPADSTAVFSEGSENLWRKSLRRIGGEYAVLANFPEDPRMN